MSEQPPDPSRYGTTPVEPDDLGALVAGLVVTTKAELDEVEAAELARVWQERAERLISGQIDLKDLTEPEALVDLHGDALGAIWTWAGRIRSREMNIGTTPASIRLQLYEAMRSVRFWADETDMSALEVAARAHHLLVQIHPFVDVNGRTTRLYADLVMLALTGEQVVDWSGADGDKQCYNAALRTADATGDMSPLLAVLAPRDLNLP